MPAPFDKLKFRPVVHLEEAVPRERLTARILDALPGTARLTLVMAPAGFGKTTVLAQIAARLAQGSDHRVAWLNCSLQDREPGVFVEDLCQACIEAGVVGVDATMGIAEMSHALGECAQPLTLFVDRYELASSAEVDALLGNLAVVLPRGVQCVVGSRVAPDLPLTTLQIEGHLRLIDVDPLRFTDDEARELLRATLPDASMNVVIARAAGWPVVLQLARLRMAAGGADPVLGAGLAGLPLHEVFDYLATQVFSALSPEDVQFLVDVAVLETIDIASANAVRDRGDSASHIERLKRMKPIVVVNTQPLGASLHPLLRDLLRSMLEREDEGGRAATLHARAAQHFAARGALHEAVSHAVLGGRIELAARILSDAGGIRMLVDQGVGRVRTLLQLLPPAIVQRHPRLRLLRIAQLLIEENGVEARLDLDRMTAGLGAMQAIDGLDEATRADLALAHVLMAVNDAEHTFRFQPWEMLAQAVAQARKHVIEDSRYLVLVLATEILMLQRYGPLDRAERRAAEAERLHEQGRYSYNIPWTWIYNARNAHARGDLALARQELQRASRKELDIFTFTHGSYGQMVHSLLGRLCLEEGALDEAFRHFEAIAPVKPMTLFEIHAGIYVWYPLCEFARGNASRALEMLANARQIAFDDNLPHLDILAAAHEVQILVATDRLALAEELARSTQLEHVLGIAGELGALPVDVVEAVIGACFDLALARGRLPTAARIADDALARALHTGHRLVEIGARLLAARGALARADAAAARAAVEQALRVAAACGAVQAFIWAGAAVRAIVRARATTARHDAAAWAAGVVAIADEGLQHRSVADALFTPRERDVLRGLVRGQSTKLIARELLLSPETIKHHLKAIFAKLGVRSRDDVVAEVRRRTLV
jgi:LuxR family maltose regulon positive regulatory protein